MDTTVDGTLASEWQKMSQVMTESETDRHTKEAKETAKNDV